MAKNKDKRIGKRIGQYTAYELEEELIDRFSLEDTAEFRDRFRKKIKSVCEKIQIKTDDGQINLWEYSEEEIEGKKRHIHMFSEYEKKLVFNSTALRKYLYKYSSDESWKREYEKEIQSTKEVEEMRKREREFYEEINWDEYAQELNAYQHYGVSGEDLFKKKIILMIEALFLKYFTPIDEDRLQEDMETSNLYPETDYNEAIHAARKRLENPHEIDYYYHKKK